jgi:putative FmdB family regulatory protein
MPTYEYICPHCGRKFDVFQSIKAEPNARCPVCGKLSKKRLIGKGGGIIFRGPGFYCNDYNKCNDDDRRKR